MVLDTNVLLDWLLYGDASTQVLVQAIDARRVTIIVNDLVVDEFRRVLAYPRFKLDDMRQAGILKRYVAAGSAIAMPPGFARETLLLPAGFPTCRDRDDQHFLALVYHARAQALLTRDKALLKLRRKAARFGVHVAALKDLSALLEKIP